MRCILLEMKNYFMKSKLHKNQYLTGCFDSKINKLCILLNRQINKFRKLIEK